MPRTKTKKEGTASTEEVYPPRPNQVYEPKLPVIWHGFLEDGVMVEPMSRDTTEFMLQLLLAGKSTDSDKFESTIHEHGMKTFIYQIMFKRLEVVGCAKVFRPSLLAFISSISHNPGDAVVWAYTLNYIYVSLATKLAPMPTGLIGIGQLCEIFPWGFPTDEARLNVWDRQKYHDMIKSGLLPKATEGGWGDNWIDDFSNWPRVEPQMEEKSDA